MSRAFVACGGNFQETPAAIDAAVELLQLRAGPLIGRSRCLMTPPMGAHAGAPFHNAAIGLDTRLTAPQLLHCLLAVESELGRIRETHWGPRLIDLDLLLFDHQILENPELQVPHPGMWCRRFVLEPLAEIAADVRHPVTGLTVADLLVRLQQRPVVLEISVAPAVPCVSAGALVEAATALYRPAFEFREAATAEFDATTALARLSIQACTPDAAPALTQVPLTIAITVDPDGQDSLRIPQTILEHIRDIVTAIAG